MIMRHGWWSLLLITASLGNIVAIAEDRFFDSDGINLHFDDEGRGAPVLLLHGFTSNIDRSLKGSGVYDGVVSAGYRAIAFTYRGHGKSDWPPNPSDYGIEMVEDARRLLDYLGVDKAHVVGYSMGGKIAVKFEELYPDRILSLAVGGIGVPFSLPFALTEEEITEFLRSRGRESELDASVIAAVASAYPEIFADESRLSDIGVPTLVIVGKDDERAERAKTLSETIPGARFKILPGTHGGANDTPEYLATIVEFLSGFDSGTSSR